MEQCGCTKLLTCHISECTKFIGCAAGDKCGRNTEAEVKGIETDLEELQCQVLEHAYPPAILISHYYYCHYMIELIHLKTLTKHNLTEH